MTDDPPEGLIRSLVDGPSRIAAVEWHRRLPSTNAEAAAAAARGVPEWHVVVADVQTAGRGRAGRRWTAPPGSSLLMSIVLRPDVAPERLPLLSLLAGVAVAQVLQAHLAVVPGAEVMLKWPNDVLVRSGAAVPEGSPRPDGKVAGILLEMPAPGVVVLGIGCNIDWHGAEPPDPGLGGLPAVSLAAARGAPVDRWRVFPAVLGVLGNRYDTWRDEPTAFLSDYRRRCATIGQRVRVERPAAAPLVGTAVDVTDRGALEVRADGGVPHRVTAGDVVHVRGA